MTVNSREKPLLSVILPVFNGARYLAEAVASVGAQRYRPLEIIIVDDGSTDETASVARSLGEAVRYVYQENQGPAAARNRALAMARGELIGFIDTDDLWTRNHLRLLLASLEADPTLQLVLGQVERQLLCRLPDGGTGFRPWLDAQHCFSLGAALFRRSAFDRIGNLDADLLASEDMDWYLRAREAGLSMQLLDEVVYTYRLHDSNMTRNKESTERLLLEVIRRSLKRRREASGPSRSLPPIPRTTPPRRRAP